jgi:hypothetical protein
VKKGSFHPASSPAFVVCFLEDGMTRMRWNLSVDLICISLMAKGVEHFSTYLLAICNSAFENCLFNPFDYLLIGLFILLVFSFLGSVYILDMNPLSGG